MSTIFPIRRQVDLEGQRGLRLVDLDEEVADDVFEALSGRTTRRIFRELHDEPRTASDLAATTETSVQNVKYHLGKLADADLVEVVDTWYSARGTEMKVYAPTDESLVLCAGPDEGGRLRSLLERAVLVLPLLAAASALVGWLTRRALDGAAVGTPYGEAESVGAAAETASDAAASAPETVAAVDPALVAGLAFFLGGALVLALAAAARYVRA